MSKKTSDEEPRVVLMKLDIAECKHGNQHIVGAEVLADSATVYEASELDSDTHSSSVGWRRSAALDANWEATFGPQKPGLVN